MAECKYADESGGVCSVCEAHPEGPCPYLEEVDDDPFAGLPFGEQQREVDWLETRYESEPEPYEYDGPWD